MLALHTGPMSPGRPLVLACMRVPVYQLGVVLHGPVDSPEMQQSIGTCLVSLLMVQ